LGLLYRLKHDLLLLFDRFGDTDDFVGLVLVREDAVNTQHLQILFTESLQLLVVLTTHRLRLTLSFILLSQALSIRVLLFFFIIIVI